MRLTEAQKQAIRRILHRHFGATASIWLFGSRLDDARRGGDYDLMVRTGITDPAQLVNVKLSALSDLHATAEFWKTP